MKCQPTVLPRKIYNNSGNEHKLEGIIIKENENWFSPYYMHITFWFWSIEAKSNDIKTSSFVCLLSFIYVCLLLLLKDVYLETDFEAS